MLTEKQAKYFDREAARWGKLGEENYGGIWSRQFMHLAAELERNLTKTLIDDYKEAELFSFIISLYAELEEKDVCGVKEEFRTDEVKQYLNDRDYYAEEYCDYTADFFKDGE